jgi:hypothetical protein
MEKTFKGIEYSVEPIWFNHIEIGDECFNCNLCGEPVEKFVRKTDDWFEIAPEGNYFKILNHE